MKNRRPIEFVFDRLRGQAKALASALHYGTARRGLAAHKQRYADDALIADHGDLGRAPLSIT